MKKYLIEHLFSYHDFQIIYKFKEFQIKSYANSETE